MMKDVLSYLKKVPFPEMNVMDLLTFGWFVEQVEEARNPSSQLSNGEEEHRRSVASGGNACSSKMLKTSFVAKLQVNTEHLCTVKKWNGVKLGWNSWKVQ